MTGMMQVAKTQVAVNFYRKLHKRMLLESFRNNKIPGVRKLAKEAGVKKKLSFRSNVQLIVNASLKGNVSDVLLTSI